MYIIGIDYGHGETSAAVLEIDDELYKKIVSLEKEDYSIPQDETDGNSSASMMLAIGTLSQTSSAISTLVEDADGNNIITCEEWNYTTIRNLLYKSFYTLKDLKIKGDSKTIKSVLAYDWKGDKWEIGPNIQKLKQCISNLDYSRNQYARMAAYFKAPLVSGKGKELNSNNLEAIKPEYKISFGLFIENVFKSIIECNTIIHEKPCNYRLYVACPSEWDNYQVEEYVRFIHEKGIHCEEAVQESRAAYMSFRDTILGNTINDLELPGVLVIDFGSSTIDFTYFGGKKTVNHGYQIGAHQVEETIFDYLCEKEPTAGDAFNKLKAALNGDELLAKTLLVFAIRNQKEQFYKDLAENEDATFADISLKDLVIPEKETGIFFSGSDSFGFDYGEGCDKAKMEGTDDYIKKKVNASVDLKNTEEVEDKNERPILDDYIKKVINAFVDFKNKEEVGVINHVILTGGASKMPFVKELAKEIYNVHKYSAEEIKSGKKDTLHIDDDSTFSISRGIAKYGTYRTLSEPIRKAIEDRLSATWRNEKWLNNELKGLTSSVTSDVYYSYFCSIVNEWKKVDSPIKSEANNNLNDLLEGIYDEILQEDPNNVLWNNIKLAKAMFAPGQRSIHALLRKLYDDIELNDKENREKIDSLMVEELTKKINLQVGSLFKKYISIYFDDTDIKINPNLPQFYNIKIEFSKEQKNKLLIKLIESICSKMDSTSTQTARTFNLDRNADSSIMLNATRNSLSPVIKEVLKEFCNEIKPDFDIEAISAACKESVYKKFAEIKDLCEKEPYSLKV